MKAIREHAARLDGRKLDAVVAVAVITELELESWLTPGIPDSHRLVTAIAAAAFAAPIAIRRSAPSFARVFCLSVAAIQTLLGGQLISGLAGDLVPLLVLSYAAGVWVDSRRSAVTLVIALGLLGSCAFLPGDGASPAGLGSVTLALFWTSLMLLPGWFAGRLARERSRRATAFRDLAAQAAAQKDERESVAIAAERARIGRELEDIIAHSVSVMVIQAGGARRLMRTDPQRARDSILNVEHTGREALADLRRLLGMLRKDDDPRSLAPQPGLSQLAALTGSISDAGFACELHTLGGPIDLTPGVDLVAYRVVEAALLAAARHGASGAVVTVCYQPHELRLEIRGNGTIPDLDQSLRDIVQRVALYDGRLQILPTGDGGFALQARLPVGEAIPA
jgi:signal transduction histidine kinase